MNYSARDLRELLATARLLRRFALAAPADDPDGLFLEAAAALEARARHWVMFGHALEAEAATRENRALHQPVDMVV